MFYDRSYNGIMNFDCTASSIWTKAVMYQNGCWWKLPYTLYSFVSQVSYSTCIIMLTFPIVFNLHNLANWNVNLHSTVHEAYMGPTWVLSAPDGPHVGPINLAMRGYIPFMALAGMISCLSIKKQPASHSTWRHLRGSSKQLHAMIRLCAWKIVDSTKKSVGSIWIQSHSLNKQRVLTPEHQG